MNLALHLVAIALVFAFTLRTLRRLGSRDAEAIALVTSALFALHPLHSQAVSYVSQRAEVLASALYLATLLLMLAADEAPGFTRRLALRTLAVVAFALGLASKPIVVTLPVAYLLHATYFPAPGETAKASRRWGLRLAAAAPLLALSAISVLLGVQATTGTRTAGLDIAWLSPERYLLTQLRVIPTYLRLLVWPAGQNVDWDFPATRSLVEPGALAAAALLAWRSRRASAPGARLVVEGRLASFGIVWFFLLLAPTSSFIPLADVIEEHRVYLASWGIFAPTAAGIVALCRGTRSRRVGLVVAVAIPCALGVALWLRNEVWRTELALWRDVVQKSPANSRAHMNLGNVLRVAGDAEGALEQYRIASANLRDHRMHPFPIMHDTAAVLFDLGRYAEAAQVLEQLLDIKEYDPEAMSELALAYLRLGRDRDAELLLRRVLAVRPQHVDAHNAYGQLLAMRGDVEGARRELEAALRIDPEDGSALYNLARIEESAGRLREACRAYARVVRTPVDPGAVAAAKVHLAALRCAAE